MFSPDELLLEGAEPWCWFVRREVALTQQTLRSAVAERAHSPAENNRTRGWVHGHKPLTSALA